MYTHTQISRQPELKNRVEEFKELCRRRNLRVTEQRLEIFRTVASPKSTPARRPYLGRCAKKCPIFRWIPCTAPSLPWKRPAWCRAVGNSNKARFDADLTPHSHFLCTACGEVYDVPAAVPDAALVPGQYW